MNNIDKIEYDTECDRLEAEVHGLFNCLKLAADPCKTSLEEAAKITISEGKKFKKWQESMQPLDNVWLFESRDQELKPICQFHSWKFAIFKSIGMSFKLHFREGTQFEIWSCERKNKPVVPLFKVLLSTFREGAVSVIEESLRTDLSIQVNAQRDKNVVTFDLLFNNLAWKSEKTALSVPTNEEKGEAELLPTVVFAFTSMVAGCQARIEALWSALRRPVNLPILSAGLKYAVFMMVVTTLMITAMFSGLGNKVKADQITRENTRENAMMK
jgi:hypothetical protein